MKSRPRAATAAALTVGALAIAGSLALPGAAQAVVPAGSAIESTSGPAATAVLPTVAPSGADTTVTVFLRAPDAAALETLAAQPITDQSAREAALAKLLPAPAQHRTVAAMLTAAGMSVGRQTSWSISATAPASIVTALFGTRATDAGHAVATGALPRVPSALASLVSAVYPTTGGPAAFHALADTPTTILAGPDFRNADTGAGVAPSTGTHSAGVTVATLQLADFAASDLTHYAAEPGNDLPDPIAAKTYRGVTVDGGPSTMDDAGEGSIEVNLDQESILSTAPSAHQAAYFAPNTDAGFNDVFANVLDDKLGDKMATAPDPHLVALSSSWGECEGLYGAANIETLEPIMASVVAAGVTIFASSGDDGIYDCRSTSGTGADNSQADVDFPSSSPFVVSSGGSNLSAPTSAPNTGSNWTEKTWTCTDADSCQNSQTGTGGGGGGASGSAFGHPYVGNPTIGGTGGVSISTTADFKGFAAPAWQTRSLSGAYAGAKTRLVPDIAADADPQTGFSVYTTLNTGLAGKDLTVGGTSLASPISAAQLANTLADAGNTTGVGDIHPALYSAMVDTASLPATDPTLPLRDVTVGQIGAAADQGSDPSVEAAKGYDTTSGVGGVLWDAMVPYLTSTGTPTVSASAESASAPDTTDDSATVPLRFVWSSAQGQDLILLDTTAVTIAEEENGKPVTVATSTDEKGSQTIDAEPGATYAIRVVGTDLAGHSASRTAVVVAAASPISPTSQPTVTGTKAVGVTITGHAGRWDPAATLGYQWLRGGHRIPGADHTTYRLAAADRGHRIALVVTGVKAGAESVSRTSIWTVSVAYGTQVRHPRTTLGGRATVGHTLTANPGRHDAGTTVHYRWYVGGKRTPVTARSFPVTRADRGRKIHAVVTATEPGYRAVTSTSRNTRPVRGR